VPKVSVTVITKNEAENLGDALASVQWADDIVVVDSQSSDDTVGIARRYTDRVVVREWPGYAEQKNYAASLARNDWILSIDADERVTPALADDIRRVLAAPDAAGYRVARVNFHLGRWVRSTDWYPDYQMRLYDRRTGEWTGRYVHESVTVRGRTETLHGELQHYAYRNISEHLETIDRYTTLAARQMHEAGRRATAFDIVAHPPLAFLRNYVAKRGFREGVAGFTISALNAYYVLLKFAKLRELQDAK
jgi:(heptosyl)LPS beta-1,4-glucosyltransferase